MDLKSLSELVKKERENKGISYEQIYRDTKIISKFIEYIENGQWEKFPSDFYKKAILKKYLEYLGIEGTILDKIFEGNKSVSEEEIVEKEPVKNKEKDKTMSYFNRKFYFVIILFFLFLLLLFIGNFLFKNLSE